MKGLNDYINEGFLGSIFSSKSGKSPAQQYAEEQKQYLENKYQDTTVRIHKVKRNEFVLQVVPTYPNPQTNWNEYRQFAKDICNKENVAYNKFEYEEYVDAKIGIVATLQLSFYRLKR